MIRLLIVDDVKSTRELIRAIVRSAADMRVVGLARDPGEAIEMTVAKQPDLIIMDAWIKNQRGCTVAGRIFDIQPLPVILLTSSDDPQVDLHEDDYTCGVLETIDKAQLFRWRTQPQTALTLLRKIRLLAKVKPTPPRRRKSAKPKRLSSASAGKPQQRIVGMVASTGGPQSLAHILGRLPAQIGAPLLIVQHMSAGFIDGMAAWLDHQTPLPVGIAHSQSYLAPNQVYIAPDDRHLVVTANQRVDLVDQPPVKGHRPSGDFLFRSLGDVFGPHAMGVLLTGMGQDGAAGLLHLKQKGGLTLAQDESSSVIFGMPKAAIELGAADKVLSLDAIAAAIQRFCQSPARPERIAPHVA